MGRSKAKRRGRGRGAQAQADGAPGTRRSGDGPSTAPPEARTPPVSGRLQWASPALSWLWCGELAAPGVEAQQLREVDLAIASTLTGIAQLEARLTEQRAVRRQIHGDPLEAQLREAELAIGSTLTGIAQSEAQLAEQRAVRGRIQRSLVAAREAAKRDWAGGLPIEVLATIAKKLVAQTEAGYEARLREIGMGEEGIQRQMDHRKRQGPSRGLFVFARVCTWWRKAQLKVGGRLCGRVQSDVILPGRVALAKWALANGCPREQRFPQYRNMAHGAALCGHLELLQWLCGKAGFAMDQLVMQGACCCPSGNIEMVQWLWDQGGFDDNPKEVILNAAASGNLELVQWCFKDQGFALNEEVMMNAAGHGHLRNLELVKWLRAEGCDWGPSVCWNAAGGGQLKVLQWLRANGCPWDYKTCANAVNFGHVKVLCWARMNGCNWDAATRDAAAAKFGYTDTLGNLIEDPLYLHNLINHIAW